MNRIKKVIRSGMPETNSSSSHSIVISRSENDLYNNLRINGDTIFIPGGVSFSRMNCVKSNDAQTKIQFICGLIFYLLEDIDGYDSIGSNVDYNWEEKLILEKVLFDFTGLKRIEYEWMNDGLDYKIPYVESYGPNVKLSIFESEETIKDFIFSPSSWLFVYSDDTDTEKNFFKVTDDLKKPEGTASITLPEIGRIDFELDFFPPRRSILQEINDLLLFSIVITDGKVTFRDDVGIANYDDNNSFYCFNTDIYSEGDKKYVVFSKIGAFNPSLSEEYVEMNIKLGNMMKFELTIWSEKFGKIC